MEDRTRRRLFGPLAPLVPSVADMFDGPQDLEIFKANGDEFLKIYQELCALGPGEKILDVGCGIGRKTVPLTQYLTSEAIYDGIDINKKGIDWCRQQIATRFPNFRFQHIDVYNQHYNPQGTCLAKDYKFPFDDDAFDFVMLGSVFTHMLSEDTAHYLSEIQRVLRTGGRCLITCFLLTEESLDAIHGGRSSLDFQHTFGNYRAVSRETPELAIAHDESWVREICMQVGLKLARVDYGSWCGRTNSITYQDLVMATK